MRKFSGIFAATLVFLLAACASSPPADFPIKSGKLEDKEMALDTFGKTNLAARVFDVVNQDTSAENNTGLSGKVDPMPADILSAYAAKKFHANGGELTSRFVIKKAGLNVSSAEVTEKGPLWGLFGDSKSFKAELRVNLSVMLVASRTDGRTANITAETEQSQQVSLSTTPEERRKAYLQLMGRAIEGIDSELNKRLPQWFDDVVVR